MIPPGLTHFCAGTALFLTALGLFAAREQAQKRAEK